MATRTVEQLAGIELSGERVDAIRCYLTGPKRSNGEFTVRRIMINDKHGISRRVYNAKVNIYRQNAEPILLGIEDRVLDPSSMPADGARAAAARPRLTRSSRRVRATASTPQRFRRFSVVRERPAGIAGWPALALRPREAQLVMPDRDQVAVAKLVLAHPAAVHETAVGAARGRSAATRPASP